MQIEIKSQELTAIIDSFGAELHSLKANGIEYLWQADPLVWNRHAPVLFPFIGGVKNKQYEFDGAVYTMPTNHGFARDKEFTLTELNSDSATFILKSDANTLVSYPFNFELIITYTIISKSINVSYKIVNAGSSAMYFYLGGHPAFNCPLEKQLNFEDYFLEYSNNESITQAISDGKSRIILENQRTIPLTHKLFDYDVFMKENSDSDKLTLKTHKSSHGVELDFKGCNCIAVWSPMRNSSFVCLEPWTSVPTNEDDNFDDLADKPHAIKIESDEIYNFNYTIRVF